MNMDKMFLIALILIQTAIIAISGICSADSCQLAEVQGLSPETRAAVAHAVAAPCNDEKTEIPAEVVTFEPMVFTATATEDSNPATDEVRDIEILEPLIIYASDARRASTSPTQN